MVLEVAVVSMCGELPLPDTDVEVVVEEVSLIDSRIPMVAMIEVDEVVFREVLHNGVLSGRTTK